jgi:ATP-dependent DNA helicase RecQ
LRGHISAARSTLKQVFGFSDFRPGQAEIVQALFDGEDVLAVMPTGSGKSLCYQLPSLVRNELTVVVSPLIALMRNQVQQLRALGIEAHSLNSASSYEESRRAQEALSDSSLRLLYVAPERLAKPEMLAALKSAGVDLLAIDEAHCVSQWGHDFRPEYLTLGEMRRAIGAPQLIALTATADAPTRKDIADELFDKPPRVFVHSFDRPNIRLAMAAKHDSFEQIGKFVDRHRGESGIVYCGTRATAEDLARFLCGRGVRAIAYHAGMDQGRRSQHQDAFLQEDGVVIVATIAFGMGIDKPDVRFIAHADMPANVESYYQEIGRAGRDGLPADTLTLYGLEDMHRRRMQIDRGGLPDERKRIERQRFNALVALCEAPRCRRQTLLSYFGEASGPCGNCDLCIEGVEVADGTIEAQKFMSAMVRTGERFGTEHLIGILLGKETEAVLRHGHRRLPTFGVGKEHSLNGWRSIVRQLYAAGLINMDISEHGRWSVTERGRRVLKGAEQVEIRKEAVAGRRKGRKRRQAETTLAQLSAADEQLLAKLKQLRTSLAREQNLPAYVVFPDSTLSEIARVRPRSLEEMRGITGIGQAKLERYGQSFLNVVLRYA